jgi:bifunctional DNA-binding transcriptional regulator/antitoxin component of YhaV-PrlF toxin-antitoxin module
MLRAKATFNFPMTVTVKNKTGLVVPHSVQRRAGIQLGDRLEFTVSSGAITITPARRAAYKPTKSELAAIRKGEAAVARGEYVSLTGFLNGVDRNRRKAGTKTSRRSSRLRPERLRPEKDGSRHPLHGRRSLCR